MDAADISPRAKQVLSLVIEEYVASARAVGSETLRERYNLSYSSATLRNEMAALEKLGYLTHLHTSGGRVPSEKGYRLFVDNLPHNWNVRPEDVLRVEHQFHQVEGNPDLSRWAELAASVLAQLVRNAALVTTPQSENIRLKRVQLIHLMERSALIVAVMSDGSIRQSVVALPHATDQDELTTVSNALTDLLGGLTPAEMVQKSTSLHGKLADFTTHLLNVVGRPGSFSTISQSGLIDMLRQPEFEGSGHSREIIESLESGELVALMSRRFVENPGIHVAIGSDIPIRQMSACSVVTATYRAPGGGYGLLSVVGPVRMPYQRTISSVYYLSQLLSRMLNPDDDRVAE